MRSFVRPVSILVVALLLGSTCFAAGELTNPTDRQGRIALLGVHQALSSMKVCDGQSPKAPIAIAGLSRYTGTGTGGGSGGTEAFDEGALGRFLQIGLQQSYDKTYEQGWNILHSVTKRALSELGQLPPGVRLALESGRDASYDRSWQDAYTILHEAVRTVAHNPSDFTGAYPETFAAYLRLGRQSGYEKSYEVGWKVLEKYLGNLESNGQPFFPSKELQLLVHAARQASYSKSWKAAYEVLHTSIKSAEGLPTGNLATFYFANALQCSYEKSYQEGYEILRTFIEQALPSGLLATFDRASLQTTLEASYNQSWQAAYEVLRDGLKALNK
ncbi:MAG: hypothetical protein HY814_07600 [Candidatus Riflebacteria bacterium]|nr:hypothetical protein [Candidatus Riflebacteria bacterium]